MNHNEMIKGQIRIELMQAEAHIRNVKRLLMKIKGRGA